MLRDVFKNILIVVFASLAITSSGFAATMNYLATWQAGSTYALGSVVKFNNGIYYSLKSSTAAPNLGYRPNANPTWWALISSIPIPAKIVTAGAASISATTGSTWQDSTNTSLNIDIGPSRSAVVHIESHINPDSSLQANGCFQGVEVVQGGAVVFSSANFPNLSSAAMGGSPSSPMTAVWANSPGGNYSFGSGFFKVTNLNNAPATFKLIYKAGYRSCSWNFSKLMVVPD